jgi:hypothetical protein
MAPKIVHGTLPIEVLVGGISESKHVTAVKSKAAAEWTILEQKINDTSDDRPRQELINAADQ